jgi:hypothetical protein
MSSTLWSRLRLRQVAGRGIHALVAGLLLSSLGLAFPERASAAETTAVAGFGVYGAQDGEEHSAVLDFEYRFRPWRLGIGPVVGMAAASNGAAYARVGLGRDFPFTERWNANISVAAAGYQRGHGKDLGRGFEFRSALDLSYQIQPGVRLGAAVAHLSNAGIGERNPGVETFAVTISFTPSRMRRYH